MSTLAVAKKDFNDAIRSWSLIGLSILFALFVAGVVFYGTKRFSPESPEENPPLPASSQ